MPSLRQRAACIGIATSPLSVRHDFMGQLTRSVPFSLRQQLNRLLRKMTLALEPEDEA